MAEDIERLRERLEEATEKWKRAENTCKCLSDALDELRGQFCRLEAEVNFNREIKDNVEAQKEREREEERQMCENIRVTLAEENENLRKRLADALFQLGEKK